MKKEQSIEDSFNKLDGIIKELQSGELTLEDSFRKYEEGMELVKSVSGSIDRVEKKMQIIENEMGAGTPGSSPAEGAVDYQSFEAAGTPEEDLSEDELIEK